MLGEKADSLVGKVSEGFVVPASLPGATHRCDLVQWDGEVLRPSSVRVDNAFI